MTTIFSSLARIEAPKTFGLGITKQARNQTARPTADDEAWWAQESARTARDQGCLAGEYLARDAGRVYRRRPAVSIVHPY